MTLLANKIQHLNKQLKKYPAACLAFSGGIDSTFLAYQLHQQLGPDRVLAVIIDSDLTSEDEAQSAVKIAQHLDLNYCLLSLKELEDPHIRSNDEEVWYYSKLLFYQALDQQAENFHPQCQLVDGMIVDDLDDYRPGLKARAAYQVESPLIDADFTKNDVRQAAKAAGIPTWNKASGCSVISRFPTGTPIHAQAVSQVLACENYVNEKGYGPCRVRYYGDLAKLELPVDQITDAMKEKDVFLSRFQKEGFKHLAIDVEGYQYGKLNR